MNFTNLLLHVEKCTALFRKDETANGQLNDNANNKIHKIWLRLEIQIITILLCWEQFVFQEENYFLYKLKINCLQVCNKPSMRNITEVQISPLRITSCDISNFLRSVSVLTCKHCLAARVFQQASCVLRNTDINEQLTHFVISEPDIFPDYFLYERWEWN